MSAEERLSQKGYSLADSIDMSTGRFLHAVRTGNLVYTSGQVSRWGDDEIQGKVGADVSVDDGYRAAELCAVNCLQAVKSLVGSLDKVTRVVKVFGMVNVASDFDDTPAVIHGCSDLLLEVFEDAGQHARSAIGLTVPHNWAVEIEIIFEVEG